MRDERKGKIEMSRGNMGREVQSREEKEENRKEEKIRQKAENC